MKYIIGLLIFIFSFSISAEEIKVKSYIKVTDKETIYVSDILDTNKLSQELQTEMNQIELGNAPKLGERIIFSNRAISIALRKILLENRGKLSIKIPRRVVVENRGHEVSQKSVTESLVSQWKKVCSECSFEILSMTLPQLPKSFVTSPWRIEVRGQVPKGSFSLPIQFATPTEKKVLWVSGQVKVYKEVPVVNRIMNFGERLQKSDIVLSKEDITYAYDGVPTVEQLVGRKLKTSLQKGSVLWSRHLAKEKALRRGDIVKVKVNSESFQIVLMAQAEQDASFGDTVRMKNLKTQKFFSGFVNNKGEVILK